MQLIIDPIIELIIINNYMKIYNRSKGFTLIELLIVISIISLLSSIVLASIKTAREKADGTKIVSELRSMQTALELYRAKFGVYPQVDFDEDELCTYYCWTGFNNFVKTYLVNNKLISKVPQSKGYPNNCIGGSCYDGNMFFYLGTPWWFDTGYPDYYYMCNGRKVSGYVLGYITNQKLNLPKFTIYNNGSTYTGLSGNNISPEVPPYEYCLSI